jgi:hypothetical protein
MRLVPINQESGEYVYVSPRYIVAVWEAPAGTTNIAVTNLPQVAGNIYKTKEPVQDVVAAIEGALAH